MLKLKPLLAIAAKERQRLSPGRGRKGSQIFDDLSGRTDDQLAKEAGVSRETIRAAEFVQKHADEETKQKPAAARLAGILEGA